MDDVGMERRHRIVDRRGQPRERKIRLAGKNPRGNRVEPAAHSCMATPMGDDGFRMGVLGGRLAAAGLYAHPRRRALPQQFLMQP